MDVGLHMVLGHVSLIKELDVNGGECDGKYDNYNCLLMILGREEDDSGDKENDGC